MRGVCYLLVYSIFQHSEVNLKVLRLWSVLLLPPFPSCRLSLARASPDRRRWTSGPFTGKNSGSVHQIRGFLGHRRRADILPVRALHNEVGPDGITRGKDVS